MRARVMAIALCLVAALGAATLTAPPAQAATEPASTVFSLTNAQRTKAGLKPLISDATLDAAAKAWAQHLASTCTFAHSTSSWRTSRTAKAGWTATGENIAAGFTSASSVMSGWMGSSGHKANILNKSYTGVGVGYATGTCGYKYYWVQIFGLSKTARAAGAGDVSGDLKADVLAQSSSGQLLVYRGNGTGGWNGSAPIDDGWNSDDHLVTLGDFDGDSITDIGRITASGDFELLRGTGGGAFGAAEKIGHGWGAMTAVIGGMDFNGDGRADVVARSANGALLLYKGDGAGGWLAGSTQIGKNWNAMSQIFYAGDFDGDGKSDLIARRSDATLWLYASDGKGGWRYSKQIGKGWSGMTAIFSPGDFDGNGTSDVLARSSDGTLRLYRGNGKGGWGAVSIVGSGWSGMVGLG